MSEEYQAVLDYKNIIKNHELFRQQLERISEYIYSVFITIDAYCRKLLLEPKTTVYEFDIECLDDRLKEIGVSTIHLTTTTGYALLLYKFNRYAYLLDIKKFNTIISELYLEANDYLKDKELNKSIYQKVCANSELHDIFFDEISYDMWGVLGFEKFNFHSNIDFIDRTDTKYFCVNSKLYELMPSLLSINKSICLVYFNNTSSFVPLYFTNFSNVCYYFEYERDLFSDKIFDKWSSQVLKEIYNNITNRHIKLNKTFNVIIKDAVNGNRLHVGLAGLINSLEQLGVKVSVDN